jgi:hypothetical protein
LRGLVIDGLGIDGLGIDGLGIDGRVIDVSRRIGGHDSRGTMSSSWYYAINGCDRGGSRLIPDGRKAKRQ